MGSDPSLGVRVQRCLHAPGLKGQGLETDAASTLVHTARVFDRPGRDCAITSGHKLRAEHLRTSFCHAHAIQQTRKMAWLSVAAVDRGLEMLQRAALQIGVGELDDEPRGVLTVVADERAARPGFVVVENRPEPLRADRISGVLGEREQLRTEGFVPGWALPGHEL